MFCPECRFEYLEGVETCPDCGAQLVKELPPLSRKTRHDDAETSREPPTRVSVSHIGTVVSAGGRDTMFCPECRFEYVEGVETCPDCGAGLVKELPPLSKKARRNDAEARWVTVLATPNPALIAVAKSLLASSGIRFFAKKETLNLAFETYGPASSPAFGPIEIQVPSEDYEAALEILKDLTETHWDDMPDETASDNNEGTT